MGRTVLRAGVLAAVYFLAATALTALSAPPNGAVLTVWLPSGVAVAALLLFGPWMAAGAFVAALAFELRAHTPLPAALLVAVANAGCELLCYYLLQGRRGTRYSIGSVRDVARLGLAAAAASLVSPCIGVTAYVEFGVVPAAQYWPNWLTWFGSVAVGILLITPFLVETARAGAPEGPPPRRLETAAALALLVLAAYLWQGPAFSRDADEPVLLVIIAGLLWVAFRFPQRAMTQAVFAFAVAAVCSAVLRLGQDHPAGTVVPIFSLQLMLGGIAMMGYTLAAMVAQQRRAAAALREAQAEAVANARKAGMAEIATNVLHNVGNVLNSVNVSAGLVRSRLLASKPAHLGNAVRLMQDHSAELGSFLAHDARGRLLPGYLSQFAQSLAADHHAAIEELDHLARSIDHIKAIVATQQSFAGVSTMHEPAQLCELVEDALRINHHAIVASRVEVVRRFAEVPTALLDRSRVIQILVNLVSNAVEAMAGPGERPRRLTVAVEAVESRLCVRVLDEGEGIAAGNLARIFSHGFTTRRRGHGFGLHSCALAAREMGGTLTAHSDGPGRGAAFTLEIPVHGRAAA